MFTILFFTLSFGANAKEKEFRVMTHLEDSFTRERIGGKAVIMKSDSTILYEVLLSGSWGESAIPSKGEPGDTVIYKFLSEGYIPVTMNFIIPEKGKMPLKKIEKILLVKDKVKKLDEVTVKTSKVKMVMKGDTLVYNADAFELSNGSMLDALIARLPGAELKDGIIKVNGEFISELLLNGESFFKGDANIALQNLPAFTVKNLKVYRKDHESAYLTGGSKDKKSLPLVMDVILKRDYATGWIGNAEAGYGIPGNRWMGRAFLLGFADNLRVTAFGNGNNINNSTTAGTGGSWSQENKMDGENRIIKEGIDYLYRNKKTKFRFNGNAVLTHNRNVSLSESSARNFIPDGDTWSRSRTNALSRDFSLSTSHTVTYYGNKLNGNGMASFQYTNNRFHSLDREATFNSEPYEKHRVSALDSVFAGTESPELIRKLSYRFADARSAATRRANGRLMHSGIVMVPGSQDMIQYNIQGNYTRNHYENLHAFETSYPHNPSASSVSNREQDRITPLWNLMSNATYAQMRAFRHKSTSLNINYSIYYNFISDSEDNAWYDITDQVSSRQAFLVSLDPENSFNQRFRSHIPEASIDFYLSSAKSLMSQTSRSDIVFSQRLNIADKINIQNLDYSSPNYQNNISRTSNFLIPTLTLSFSHNHYTRSDSSDQWMQGARNAFSLKYEYRETESPLSYDLDYRRSPNPMNVYLPNHDLKRSSSHNIEFNWQHNGINQRMMSIYSYLRIRPRTLVQARFYDRETGISTWMPDNVSGNWNSYIHFKFSKPVTRTGELQFSTTTYYFHDNNVDFVSASYLPERCTVVTDTPGETLTLSWQHRKVVLSGGINAEMKAARSARPDFTDINLFYIAPNFSTTLPLPANFQFTTNINAVKHFGYSDPNLKKAEVLWNAEINKSIFDGHLLLKLRAYDILGRVNPNKTVINAQGIIETFSNTLTRYVMMQVTYNFTKKPQKKDNVVY